MWLAMITFKKTKAEQRTPQRALQASGGVSPRSYAITHHPMTPFAETSGGINQTGQYA